MMNKAWAGLLAVALWGCGDDDAGMADDAGTADGAMRVDGSMMDIDAGEDSGMDMDTGTEDAGRDSGPTTDGGDDAAVSDGGADAAMTDAAADAGTDAAMTDAGTDAAMTDAGTDAAMTDAAMTDAGTDAAMTDAGTDAAMTDAGTDAAMADAGTDSAMGDAGTDSFVPNPDDPIFTSDGDTLAIFELNGDLEDDSGNGRDLTANSSVSYVNTEFGMGLSLPGENNQGVDWGRTNAMLITDPWTIEMVVVPDDTEAYKRLFTFDTSLDEGWYFRSNQFRSWPNDYLGWVIPGRRQYLAFVSTPSNTMDIYINGVLVGNDLTGFASPPLDAMFFEDDGTSEEFSGVVDAIRISSVARTSGEIAAVQAVLEMRPTLCDNGVQDAMETDVDCGGGGCIPCNDCTDMSQGTYEEGVDCGILCGVMCT